MTRVEVRNDRSQQGSGLDTLRYELMARITERVCAEQIMPAPKRQKMESDDDREATQQPRGHAP